VTETNIALVADNTAVGYRAGNDPSEESSSRLVANVSFRVMLHQTEIPNPESPSENPGNFIAPLEESDTMMLTYFLRNPQIYPDELLRKD
jgi:hypothetical protein